jgi:hypothetical protein
VIKTLGSIYFLLNLCLLEIGPEPRPGVSPEEKPITYEASSGGKRRSAKVRQDISSRLVRGHDSWFPKG